MNKIILALCVGIIISGCGGSTAKSYNTQQVQPNNPVSGPTEVNGDAIIVNTNGNADVTSVSVSNGGVYIDCGENGCGDVLVGNTITETTEDNSTEDNSTEDFTGDM